MTVAIVTHDLDLSQLVEKTLAQKAIVCAAHDTDTALMRSMRSRRVDLVIIDGRETLDLLLPLLAWRECHSRSHFSFALIADFADPKLILQARAQGVEEFIRSPVDPAEVLLRTCLILNRLTDSAEESNTLAVGAFHLSKIAGAVKVHGVDVTLTAREFATAWLMFSNPGVTLDRAFISRAVWGNPDDIATRTLEQHIYRLRRKLDFGAAQGVHLRTIYAGGYRLVIDDEPRLPASQGPYFRRASDSRLPGIRHDVDDDECRST